MPDHLQVRHRIGEVNADTHRCAPAGSSRLPGLAPACLVAGLRLGVIALVVGEAQIVSRRILRLHGL